MSSSSVKEEQLRAWDAAVEAARRRAYQPAPADVLIPWTIANLAATEFCTAAPFPAVNRITLFLRTTLGAMEIARKLNSDFFVGMKMVMVQEPSGDKDVRNAGFSSSISASLASITGQIELAIEKAPGDHMYDCNVLLLTNTIPETRSALESLASFFPPGCSSIVAHDVVSREIRTVMGHMTLMRRTGVERTVSSASNLTTIFELHDVNAPVFESPKGREPHGIGLKVVARCVVAYRDGSQWSSVGPTVSSIAVRRDYQGFALIQDLFNVVEAWMVDSWRLDTIFSNRILKATKLMDVIVDRVLDEDELGGPHQELQFTDKIFFFEVMGFTVNRSLPTGLTAGVLPSRITSSPPESEAIKYYPPTGTKISLPSVNYVSVSLPNLWRSCDNCRRLSEDTDNGRLLVCGGCPGPNYWAAHYCSHFCQRADWNCHKLWCHKTYDEVCSAKAAVEGGA